MVSFILTLGKLKMKKLPSICNYSPIRLACISSISFRIKIYWSAILIDSCNWSSFKLGISFLIASSCLVISVRLETWIAKHPFFNFCLWVTIWSIEYFREWRVGSELRLCPLLPDWYVLSDNRSSWRPLSSVDYWLRTSSIPSSFSSTGQVMPILPMVQRND